MTTVEDKKLFELFEKKEYEKCLSELNLSTNIKNKSTIKHNILIIKYFSKKINLEELLKELENFENPNETMIYNLSILYFKKEKYSKTIQLLSNLFLKIETIEEQLAMKICFLLLEVYLNQNRIKESEKIINYLENSFKLILSTEIKIKKISMKEISNFSFQSSKILLNYYKNRFLLLNKKYNFNNIFVGGGLNIPLMESHLKTITNENESIESMKILIENKKEIDSFIYFSNLGYISVKMNKLNLSLYYLNKAIKDEGEKDKSKISSILLSKHYYNRGLILMKLKRYKDAFECFKN